jgi:hypothetical protein
MSEFDYLLSKSMVLTIKENLGEMTLQKIEKRLFEKHGINLAQAIQEFNKLDSVLREFFGGGAEGLEKQILRKTITLEDTVTQDPSWVTLESKSLSRSILEALADPEKNNILNSVLIESKVPKDILEICKITLASGHRKLNSLINEGLLVADGSISTTVDNKEIKFRSIFENVKMDIDKNNVILKIKIPTIFLEKSSIIQVMEAC